jgi:hypothetical protein
MKKLVLLACVGSAFSPSVAAASASIAPSVAVWSESSMVAQDAAPDSVAPVEEAEEPSAPTIDQPNAPESRSAAEAAIGEVMSPWEKWSFSFGGMLVAPNSDVRFGAKGVGVEVDVEDALGLKSSTTSYRFEGAWRFSDNLRHRTSLSWIDLGRSGELTTDQDIDLGDGNVIPAGTGVKTGFQINLIRADYSYSFLQDDRVDLAATFGFYVAPMDISLEATTGGGFNESFDVTAPLPLIGLRMDFLVAPKWYLRSSFSLFYLEIDGYRGGMSDIMLAAEYRPWKHFSVGLGLDNFRLAVEATGETAVPGIDALGQVEYNYNGVMLYVKGLW